MQLHSDKAEIFLRIKRINTRKKTMSLSSFMGKCGYEHKLHHTCSLQANSSMKTNSSQATDPWVVHTGLEKGKERKEEAGNNLLSLEN